MSVKEAAARVELPLSLSYGMTETAATVCSNGPFRWREGERLIQAIATEVRRDDLWLHISVEGVTPLPPEAFFP